MIKDINPSGNINDWCPAPSSKAATPESLLRQRLRVARAAVGISQRKLGLEIGVLQQTVSYWEITGNIPSSMLGKLSDALDVQMEYWRV